MIDQDKFRNEFCKDTRHEDRKLEETREGLMCQIMRGEHLVAEIEHQGDKIYHGSVEVHIDPSQTELIRGEIATSSQGIQAVAGPGLDIREEDPTRSSRYGFT